MAAMSLLDLSVDEVLSTTRAVRRRLDLERPVEREVIDECLRLALQAPTASNTQPWHFVVVTDPERRAALAECYRVGWTEYSGSRPEDDGSNDSPLKASSRYLARHMHEVPVHVLACVEGRLEGADAETLAARMGSVIQGGWSFQLAARARGLGSTWTTLHLKEERKAAEAIGIPYDEVMQVALIPTAYTLGTDFKSARRRPVEDVVHWDRW
jgi:nitroreductase